MLGTNNFPGGLQAFCFSAQSTNHSSQCQGQNLSLLTLLAVRYYFKEPHQNSRSACWLVSLHCQSSELTLFTVLTTTLNPNFLKRNLLVCIKQRKWLGKGISQKQHCKAALGTIQSGCSDASAFTISDLIIKILSCANISTFILFSFHTLREQQRWIYLKGVGYHMGKSWETCPEVTGKTSPAATLFGLTSPSNWLAEKSQSTYNKTLAQTDRCNITSMQKN